MANPAPVISMRLALLGVAIALCAPAFAYEYPLQVVREDRGRATLISIANRGPAPVNTVIELTSSDNAGFSPAVIGSKFPHLVLPGQTKPITTAVPIRLKRPARFSYRYRFAFGDPDARHDDDYAYRLPIPDKARAVVRGYTGAHVSTTLVDTSNAAQIGVPRGTPVVAARPGVVMSGNGFSNLPPEPTDSPRSPIGTYVSILHADGTWSTYGWLKANSVLPSPGDAVNAGQVIAQSDSNPDAIESYFFYGVNRNLFGLTLRGVSFKFRVAGFDLISPSTFVGQVSPTLPPLYRGVHEEAPWMPSHSSLPDPPPPRHWDDEGLNPAQRQALFRQRLLESSDSLGTDTVVGSRPLLFLSLVAVFLGSALTLAIISTHSSSKPSGVRGVFWTLLRGRPPVGSVQYDPTETSRIPIHQSLLSTILRKLGPPPPLSDLASDVDTDSPTLPTPTTSTDSAASAPATTNQQVPASHVSAAPASPERDPVSKPLIERANLALLASINRLLTPRYVVSHRVPLRQVTDLFLHPEEVDLSVDFLVVSTDTGHSVLAIQHASDPSDRERCSAVARKLGLIGLPSLLFEAPPSDNDLKVRFKRLGLV